MMLVLVVCSLPMAVLALLAVLEPDDYFDGYLARLKRKYGLVAVGLLFLLLCFGLLVLVYPVGPLLARELIGLGAIILPICALLDNLAFWVWTFRRRS